MIRTLLLAAMVAAMTLMSAVPMAGPLSENHPLIGTWKVTFPDGSCYEIYRIRANGTMVVTSAEDVTETEFEIPDHESPKGFYKWVDTITKDNGKRDCFGEIMEVGHVATNYLRFHPSGNMFLMCMKEDMKTCIGPFVRMKESDT